MGDHSKSQLSKFYSILGVSKSASLADICKAYKALVLKWHPDRHPSNKAEAQAKLRSINEAYRALNVKKKEEANAASNGDHQESKKQKKKKSSDKKDDSSSSSSDDEFQISSPTLLSRTTSRISPGPSPTCSSSTWRNLNPLPMQDFYNSFANSSGGNTPTTPSTPTKSEASSLSKVASRRCAMATPIFFSQSAVKRKPPPVEKKLECTLEELCLGCVKKIKITRDAISNSGLIVEEEEILMIKIQPGWRRGTKITFEGKGDERPGSLPADIIFAIDEKRHPLYQRVGDDLELGVEVPLDQALTGCTLPVPLLGGGQMNVSIDDIIYPGYEKIVPGHGMPISKDGKRGNLKLKFLVDFPAYLSDEQRSQIVGILEQDS